MSHWHIDVYVPVVVFNSLANTSRVKATLCVPFDGMQIVEGIMIIKPAAKQGPFHRAYAPVEWSGLKLAEDETGSNHAVSQQGG